MSVLVGSKKLKRAVSTIEDFDLPDDPALRQIEEALDEWLKKPNRTATLLNPSRGSILLIVPVCPIISSVEIYLWLFLWVLQKNQILSLSSVDRFSYKLA